jgi:HK97 family phage major capsid protein
MTKHDMAPFDAPIELKDAAEGFSDDANDVVTKALGELTATIDERLKEIEAKSADADKRFADFEKRLARPGIVAPAVITKKDAAELESKAFDAYCRRGDAGLSHVEVKALSVGVSGASGGYLVPPSWLTELEKNLVLSSPMRSVARVVNVGVPVVTLPKRTANLSSTWVSETGARTESDPTYGQQNFTVYEVAGYVDVSNQLLEDSMFPLEQELAKDIGQELGRAEGAAFVNGDGNGKPTGLLHTPVAGSIVDAAGATIAADDLIEAFYSLPTAYAANGVWLMNRKTLGLIRKMKASGSGEYLWHENASAEASLPFGGAGTLLGKPIVEMPDFPDVAPSTVSVVFGDMSNYRIFDRVGVELLRDPYTQRASGQTRFHFRKRVGGDVSRAEGIRFLKTTA